MYYLLIVFILAADQISKYFVRTNMTVGENIGILPGIFDLTYVQNTGSAYSMFEGKQTFLLIITTALMVCVILYLIFMRKRIAFFERFSLFCILGGGIGNMIDRILRGYVVDFFNIHIIPVFNVADIFITCGCILFAFTVLFSKDKR